MVIACFSWPDLPFYVAGCFKSSEALRYMNGMNCCVFGYGRPTWPAFALVPGMSCENKHYLQIVPGYGPVTDAFSIQVNNSEKVHFDDFRGTGELNPSPFSFIQDMNRSSSTNHLLVPYRIRTPASCSDSFLWKINQRRFTGHRPDLSKSDAGINAACGICFSISSFHAFELA